MHHTFVLLFFLLPVLHNISYVPFPHCEFSNIQSELWTVKKRIWRQEVENLHIFFTLPHPLVLFRLIFRQKKKKKVEEIEEVIPELFNLFFFIFHSPSLD